MEFNQDNPFVVGFVMAYKEGDLSLERIPLIYTPSINDKLHPVTNWDTLPDLSYDYYGSSKWWWVIGDINSIFDPFSLTPNTNIIIPDLDLIRSQF